MIVVTGGLGSIPFGAGGNAITILLECSGPGKPLSFAGCPSRRPVHAHVVFSPHAHYYILLPPRGFIG